MTRFPLSLQVSRGRLLTMLALLVLGPLLVCGPLSSFVASRLPVAPPVADVPLHSEADPAAARALVRDLPAGLTGDEIRDPRAILTRAAVEALGAEAALWLLLHLERGSRVDYYDRSDPEFFGAYPGRYRWIERLLDGAPSRAQSAAAGRLAAVLIALDKVKRPEGSPVEFGYPDAAPVAYALLRRAHQEGGCDAEINQLLLLTADDKPHDDLVADQGSRATAACPNDPTALWLLGQFQSQRALVAGAGDLPEMESDLPKDRVARAERTANLLVSRFPGSPDAWLGLGDMHLRAGGELSPLRPFTGRRHYQTAEAAYRRAQQLGTAGPAALGRARALIGLEEPQEATSLLGSEPGDWRHPGPALDVLVESQEAAHDFPAAMASAKRLAQMGSRAYPEIGPLYPRRQPLTTGADRYVSLTVRLAPGDNDAGGGASVGDVSFIPQYRPDDGLTGSDDRCPEWSWRRDAVLAGDPRSALAGLSTSRPASSVGDCWQDRVAEIAEAELRPHGQPWSEDDQQNRIEDGRQNLWRWAGDLEKAATVAVGWDAATRGTESLPALRLAEIRYLQGRYAEAAAAFGVADRRSETGYAIDPFAGRARLGRGTALLAAGRQAEGLEELRELERRAALAEVQFRRGIFQEPSVSDARSYALLSYYARLQLADAERTAGQIEAALEDYAAARELLPRLLEQQQSGIFEDDVQVVPGVLDNQQALAELAAGHSESALAHAQAAVAADPANPAFQLTSASAAQQAGDHSAALRMNENALRLDSSAFPAANNLAVILASSGRFEEATFALRRAIGARPDYGLGWYNLGVLYGKRGPLYLLSAQGALGKAYQLEPNLKDQRTLRYDEHVYQTGLDLSKPLPAGWGIASAERRQPLAALGLIGVVAAALGLTRAAGGGAGSSVEKMIAPVLGSLRRLRWLSRRRHLGWALAMTAVAFALSLLWSGGYGLWASVAYLVAIGCLGSGVVIGRLIMAERAKIRVIQRTWPPGLVVGLIAGSAGTPWAPLPAVRGPVRFPRIHLVGPILLVAVATALLIEWVTWQVPLTRAVAVAAVTMAVSILIPLRPMDGAMVGKAGLLVGAGAVAIVVLTALGLL